MKAEKLVSWVDRIVDTLQMQMHTGFVVHLRAGIAAGNGEFVVIVWVVCVCMYVCL